ncbi:hypothetical protein MLD38_005367 [Melastoma candidum]|uniref:Uncharacterized protein n=1 Tax=Melastoma candidum TaxID=119954 RepID=A0ACB9S7T3_9MYRT|nr:hypothetical protein MLD38_005367 [Melastoma candidum]
MFLYKEMKSLPLFEGQLQEGGAPSIAKFSSIFSSPDRRRSAAKIKIKFKPEDQDSSFQDQTSAAWCSSPSPEDSRSSVISRRVQIKRHLQKTPDQASSPEDFPDQAYKALVIFATPEDPLDQVLHLQHLHQHTFLKLQRIFARASTLPSFGHFTSIESEDSRASSVTRD